VTTPPEARPARGLAAEELACRHLEEAGMTVVARNFRAKGGEIDVVARVGDRLVFVEVRSREDSAFGSPEETVGLPKRRRIVAAAKAYLAAVPTASWREARFDVVVVEGTGGKAVIRHYPGAFDARGKVL